MASTTWPVMLVSDGSDEAWCCVLLLHTADVADIMVNAAINMNLVIV